MILNESPGFTDELDVASLQEFLHECMRLCELLNSFEDRRWHPGVKYLLRFSGRPVDILRFSSLKHDLPSPIPVRNKRGFWERRERRIRAT